MRKIVKTVRSASTWQLFEQCTYKMQVWGSCWPKMLYFL